MNGQTENSSSKLIKQEALMPGLTKTEIANIRSYVKQAPSAD